MGKNDANATDEPKEKKVRSKAKKKPKNPLSSYLLYCNEVRDKFREANKGMKMGQVSKLIAADWKALSEEDKKQYVDKSVELRAEWKTAMEEYKKSEQYTEFLAVLKQWNE